MEIIMCENIFIDQSFFLPDHPVPRSPGKIHIIFSGVRCLMKRGLHAGD